MLRVLGFGIAALGALTVFSTSLVAKPVKPPSTGVYTTNKFIIDVSGTGCVNSSDENLLGVMDFGGLSASKSALRSLINQYTPSIETETFTTTQGSGTTSQSGNFSMTVHGSGSADVNGTFSFTITEIDQFSFTMRLQENYGSCEEDVAIALTKTGEKL